MREKIYSQSVPIFCACNCLIITLNGIWPREYLELVPDLGASKLENRTSFGEYIGCCCFLLLLLLLLLLMLLLFLLLLLLLLLFLFFLLLLLLCFWPPIRALCQNHEVVVFQPRTGNANNLGSVAN